MAGIGYGVSAGMRDKILEFSSAVLRAGDIAGLSTSEIATGAMYACMSLCVSDASFTKEMALEWVEPVYQVLRKSSAAGGSDAQA